MTWGECPSEIGTEWRQWLEAKLRWLSGLTLLIMSLIAWTWEVWTTLAIFVCWRTTLAVWADKLAGVSDVLETEAVVMQWRSFASSAQCWAQQREVEPQKSKETCFVCLCYLFLQLCVAKWTVPGWAPASDWFPVCRIYYKIAGKGR